MNTSKYARTDHTAHEAQLEPLLVTAEQAAALLAICRTKVYELLRNGDLESVLIGSSRRIPMAVLETYIERLRQQSRPMAAIRSDEGTIRHQESVRRTGI